MKLILQSPYPAGMMKRTPVPPDLAAGAPRWGIAQCISNDKIQIVEWQFHPAKFSTALWSADASVPIEFSLAFTRPAIVLGIDLFTPPGLAANTHAAAALGYFPAGSTPLLFRAGRAAIIRFELKEAALKSFTSDHPEALRLITLSRTKSLAQSSLPSIPIDYRETAILEGIKRSNETGQRLLIELEFGIFKLLQLYFEKLRLSERPKSNGPDEAFAWQVRDYILISPNIQSHSIEKLSRHFLVSATVLKQRFHRTMGVSVGIYVHRHALKRAKFLILSTAMTINEIADETGYEFVNNFNRAFKTEFGETPFSMLHRRQNNV